MSALILRGWCFVPPRSRRLRRSVLMSSWSTAGVGSKGALVWERLVPVVECVPYQDRYAQERYREGRRPACLSS